MPTDKNSTHTNARPLLKPQLIPNVHLQMSTYKTSTLTNGHFKYLNSPKCQLTKPKLTQISKFKCLNSHQMPTNKTLTYTNITLQILN